MVQDLQVKVIAAVVLSIYQLIMRHNIATHNFKLNNCQLTVIENLPKIHGSNTKRYMAGTYHYNFQLRHK